MTTKQLYREMAKSLRIGVNDARRRKYLRCVFSLNKASSSSLDHHQDSLDTLKAVAKITQSCFSNPSPTVKSDQ